MVSNAAEVQRRASRREVAARYGGIAWIFALSFVLWAPRISGPIDLRYDAGVYYVLGASLASGEGYRIASEPGAPEGIQYPPLLPALVAVHQWILGTIDPITVAPWLRMTNAAIFSAYLLAVFALARRFLASGLALMATTLCAVSYQTLFLSDLLFTELPFALVSVWFALVAGTQRSAPRPPLRDAAVFALGTTAFLLRTAGIALLAAWILEAFLQRRWRAGLVRAALVLVPVALWQAHILRVQASEEYRQPAYAYQRAPYQHYNVSYSDNISLVDPFQPELGHVNAGMFATRVASNIGALPRTLGEAMSVPAAFWEFALWLGEYRVFKRHPFPPGLARVPLVALAALAAIGLLALIRRGAWLIAGLIVASVALACLTPWTDQLPRYLSPLAPFLWIAAILAPAILIEQLRAKMARRWTLAAGVAVGAFLAMTFVVQAWVAGRELQSREPTGALFARSDRAEGARPRLFYYDRGWQAWEQAITWIKAHSQPDAIIATTSPHLAYLLSGRRSVFPPMESDPLRTRQLLEAVPVSHVVVDELWFRDISRRYAYPAVQAASERWQLVHSIGATQIYVRVARTGAGQARPGSPAADP